MSEEGAQHFALRALQCSSTLGLKSQHSGLRYLNLMLLLGVGFDDDPQLPWARGALHDASRGEELMASLWSDAVVYVKRVAGPKGRAYRKALLRTRALTKTVLMLPTWTKASDGASLLAALYPEKFATIEKSQEDFFEVALRHCQRHDEKAKGVAPLYQVLMFLLGSHFEVDPRYDWASKALGERPLTGRGAYHGLFDVARTALDGALQLLREG
ncbi:hypothetical protein F0U59_45825 [Archangium gephyra]|nr:hypothetical protein F0U59_45825 [Archangium gephyra]